MLIRQPVVSGSFYPSKAKNLKKLLGDIQDQAFNKSLEDLKIRQIIGGIVPHAGYVYSGYEAMHFFEILRQFHQPVDTFVIIHPDHYGMGEDMSVDGHDQWRTPLGTVSVDDELRAQLSIKASTTSEAKEHSAEVILPFLQHYVQHEFRILPISMKKQSIENARTLATWIAQAKEKLGKNLVLIASSDFSHYVKPEMGFYYDNVVIDRITNFDQRGLYETVMANNLTVCGYGPILTLMFYAQMSVADPKVEVLARGNSAKRHQADLVVDYVSALFLE